MRWRSLPVLLLCLHTVQAQQVFIDDLGYPVALAAPAQRIVSLAPHITELLFDAGLGERLVATVDYSDYPDAARQVPRIGDAGRIDQERLLALQPDLVIAWGTGTPQREQQVLRRLGVPLYLSEPRRLEDIATQLLRFGELADAGATAAAAADRYRQALQTLRDRFQAGPQPVVFYQLAQQPLLTVNRQHIIHAVLELCGAVNPFAELAELTPRVDVEAVVMARPALVVHALYPGQQPDAVETFWRSAGLSATTRFVAVPGDHIHRQTPRILRGAEQICKAVRSD